MTGLFRPEAVTHASRKLRLSGEVLLATPHSHRLLTVLLLLVVAAGAVVFATASYSRKETVSGWLTPDGGLIRVKAEHGGTVEAIYVQEGQAVPAGKHLASLRLSSETVEGDLGMALRRGMDLEAQASEARFEAQQAKLSAELAQLNDRRSGLSRELQESHRSVALQTERVRLATAEVVRAQEVAEKGFLPRQQLDARRSAALEQENELAVLRTAMLRLEREIGEVDARLRALPADGRAQEAEAASARALTLQRRTEVQARSSYVARATRAGRVAVLPVEVGQNLQSGAAVAVLMPVGSGLEAEIYVPSRAAGFIRKGQEVRLMYQAFPYQKFGTSRGTIESVSRTVLSPGELTLPGVSVREPVFRVRVALQDQAIKAYGELIPLQPGMLLRADIVIDRRTLLELLLDPLYAAGRRG